jgi:hypothetical protein
MGPSNGQKKKKKKKKSIMLSDKLNLPSLLLGFIYVYDLKK